MKILLTGSTGFVGSRVLFFLQQQGHTVSCLPSDMLKGEFTDERLCSLFSYTPLADVIIHMAAISSTAYSEQHPDESYAANVMLPQTMAKLAVQNKCKLIYFSSDQVYSGSTGTKPNSEKDNMLTPVNVYGRHKLEAEKQILDVSPDAVALRLSWMYDMPVYRTKSNNNFVLSLMKSALTGKGSTYSVNDFRGITYVRSVAENIQKTFELPGGVYNYGSENEKNMYETACEFMNAMGMADRISDLIKSTDTQLLRNLKMDCSKIREYGISFELTTEGIKKLISDYKGLF